MRTYPLADRKSQVTLSEFARPHAAGQGLAAFLDGLPRILAADTLRRVAGEILRARSLGKPIVWGLGAHVLKVGLSPVLVDLMERGLVTAIALNGAGIVHDFELAVAGHTSEDVAAGLGAGEFGMARETGEEINRAIVEGDAAGPGAGGRARPLPRARAPAARPGRACSPPRAGSACRSPCTSPSAPTSCTCTPPAIRARWAAPRTSTSGSSPAWWRGWAGAGST